MLKGIDPVLSGELLKILDEMGHGDQLLLVDRNYPAAASGKPVVRLGEITVTRAAEAILGVLPLDRFIDHSQFIIVTHSKRTMARADVMYGVTMEEFGVSKPVGMRLTHSDAAKDNADKGEAKTAAQKAALRLDA